MKPLKRMFFCGILPAAIITISLSASTQYAAHRLAYQKSLGLPAARILGYPLYNPTRIIPWYYHFHSFAPNELSDSLIFAYVGSFFGLAIAIIFFAKSDKKPAPTSHGTAKWANTQDLQEAKLLEGKGVVLGVSKDGRYLRHDGPEHVICMAPTRSGKGVGIIIPTLLTWPHSVVVTDIKGENWGITAGYRKLGLKNKVMKFDPTDSSGNSVRYNPLEEIRIGTKLEVKDTQNIADILVDPQGTGSQDHWAKTGHALLVGAILHVMYSKEIKLKTLTSIAICLSNPQKSIEETLEEMLKAQHDPDFEHGWRDMGGQPTATHPVVAAAARELLNKSENERSGVLSTAMSFLGLYRDPIVSANTQASDFKITDLMNSDTPVSLYLVVPPSDLSRTRPLMRMIINQIGRTLTESMEFKDGRPVQSYRHRLLLLLDEFPALGRLDFFESALAFIAGYGLKALLIVQSLNQLNKSYTQDNSIMDNCHIRTVFTPNDFKTAQLISNMLSEKTELIDNQSFSGERASFFLKNVSRSTQQIARKLMTPGEVLLLPRNEEIIFVAGGSPIKANKLFYFKDENFKTRLRSAPEKSDVCRVNPAHLEKPGEAVIPEQQASHLPNELEAAELALQASDILTTLKTWASVEKERGLDEPGLEPQVLQTESSKEPHMPEKKATQEYDKEEDILNMEGGFSI